MATSERRRPRRPRPGRLDQPVAPRRAVPRPRYDAEAFGRMSERIARFIGTGRFLVYQTAFITVWIVANVALPTHERFDPYPLQFLTLILSLQAAYAAPLILLAQNRQDDRDRVNLDQDRQQGAKQGADTDFVARELASVRLALGDVVTRDFLRSELRALLDEGDMGGDHTRKDKKKKPKRSDVIFDTSNLPEQDPDAVISPPEGLSSPPETPMPTE